MNNRLLHSSRAHRGIRTPRTSRTPQSRRAEPMAPSFGATAQPQSKLVKKKLDSRIRTLLENNQALRHRTLLIVIGDRGRDQVVNLHYIQSKLQARRPRVLWCYKKDLGFTTHRQKRARKIARDIKRGIRSADDDDPFELFLAATDIRYCYYRETDNILGNTYGTLVLQDFAALTPNLLARTIETVEGGGLVIMLLKTMTSLQQLYTMAMDVHARYRTEAHQDVVGRFNERFLLSVAQCSSCLMLDDELNILPISSHIRNIKPIDEIPQTENSDLQELIVSLRDTQPIGALIALSKTIDQAKALLTFTEAISEKTLRSTVALTAARGRGKSAAMGLSIAAAIAYGYSNIFVTSPSPENLRTLFEIMFKGFDALELKEHQDYEIIQSSKPEFNKAIVRVNIFHTHRQTVQYINPDESKLLSQAELLLIDEAAAIPLALVKKLLGPYLVFMSSTINGYEGTGRSLSLKLIKQLRSQSAAAASTLAPTFTSDSGAIEKTSRIGSSARVLREIQLDEPIRYAINDPIELWLNDLLCLNCTNQIPKLVSGIPHPSQCELYYVDRDTLFSFHTAAEVFLQRMMSLYVSSHYKNSPNDLQLMSDAPAHHLFVLLGPSSIDRTELPDILVVIQVCLEGEISKQNLLRSFSKGIRASGDLIPWCISQQFQNSDFASLSGARIVRIATHPELQKMGYATKAIELLNQYYDGLFVNLEVVSNTDPKVKKHCNAVSMSNDVADCVGENDDLRSSHKRSADTAEFMDDSNSQVAASAADTKKLELSPLVPRADLPPLLVALSDRRPEFLHYVGVSFGLTQELFSFWRKSGFLPLYLRQTASELTGEHSCIVVKTLQRSSMQLLGNDSWLTVFNKDFQRRLLSLFGYDFAAFPVSLGLTLALNNETRSNHADEDDAVVQSCSSTNSSVIDYERFHIFMTDSDIQRLDGYSKNLVDYHMILDLIPVISRLYFTRNFNFDLTYVQCAILLGIGLQRKNIQQLEAELQLGSQQILAQFNKAIRKVTAFATSLQTSQAQSEVMNVDVA